MQESCIDPSANEFDHHLVLGRDHVRDFYRTDRECINEEETEVSQCITAMKRATSRHITDYEVIRKRVDNLVKPICIGPMCVEEVKFAAHERGIFLR